MAKKSKGALRVREVAAHVPPPAQPDPFKPAKPPPGVLPKGIAFDQAINPAALQWAANGTVGEGLVFLGYPALAEMAQRPENRRIVEIIAKEMTRKWVRLVGTGDAGEDKAERIAQLEKALKKYGVQDLFRRAAEHDGYFGRGQIYVDIRGSKPELPLVISSKTIKQGALQALRLIEPVWTYPTEYDSSNPLSDDFYRPRGWYVMGQRVHASRMLTFVGREVPDILKPAYSFGGLALTQMAIPYVQNWLRTRQSVSDLLHSFSVSGLKTNMGSVLDGEDDGLGMYARAQMFNQTRDNRGLMLIDKDTEEFFNVSTPLTTLDKLQAQSQEHMASVSGIPLVKLLGITPSGLNATSDGEIRVFYDWIEHSSSSFS
jgi:phage-related protein (TIGR01555 family)